MKLQKNARDLTGIRFGKLVAIRPVEREKKYTNLKWECICDCGNTKEVQASNLVSGHAKSCGCGWHPKGSIRNFKHGLTRTRIGNIYRSMVNRCYKENIKNKGYYDRGITVCDEWLGENGIINFVEWAKNNGYKDTLTLDRIDPNGHYEPSNCRWATQKEQANNKRNNIYITWNGETKTASQWAEIVGLKASTIRQRYHSGWGVEDILFKPLQREKLS